MGKKATKNCAYLLIAEYLILFKKFPFIVFLRELIITTVIKGLVGKSEILNALFSRSIAI